MGSVVPMGSAEVEEAVAGRPRTFDDVQREDAEFKAAAAAPALDPTVEGAALKSILSDAGACERCESIGRDKRGPCKHTRAHSPHPPPWPGQSFSR